MVYIERYHGKQSRSPFMWSEWSYVTKTLGCMVMSMPWPSIH